MTLSGLLLILTIGINIQSEPVPPKGPNRELSEFISGYHSSLKENRTPLLRTPETSLKAYAEFENQSYLFVSAKNYFNSLEIKEVIAKHLPESVTFVILGDNSSEVQKSLNFYSQWISQDRLVGFVFSERAGFWLRDSLPVPSLTSNGDLSLADAKYFKYFEPDVFIASLFKAQLFSHPYYFEGGNILADDDANCFVVNSSRVVEIPNTVFNELYGCHEVHRLPHLGGIGHIDERLKIFKNKQALTDRKEIKVYLESIGYEVGLLPQPENYFETYANALILEDKVFVPSFDQDSDEEAFRLYSNLGFEVIPISSSKISNSGKGSVHCFTMVYPHAELSELAEALQVEVL